MIYYIYASTLIITFALRKKGSFMKAWRIKQEGILEFDELESQSVGEGQVKLKMLYSSISSTDVMTVNGKITPNSFPLILGRQGVGMVTEVGEGVTKLVRGARVVVDTCVSCNSCATCKSGNFDDCEKLSTYGVNRDGFLRDFAVINSRDARELPERVSSQDAVFTEYVAIAVNAMDKLSLNKGDHIVIVGANVLGIIMAQVAMYYQFVPIIIDTRQDRLDVAKDLGVYFVINSVDADPYKKLFSITGGRLARAVAYVTASKMSFSHCLDYACFGGEIAIVGWSDEESELNANLDVVFKKQLTVFGINNGARNMSTAINMLATGAVDVKSLVSKEVGLLDVKDAIEERITMPNKYMKVLVKM